MSLLQCFFGYRAGIILLVPKEELAGVSLQVLILGLLSVSALWVRKHPDTKCRDGWRASVLYLDSLGYCCRFCAKQIKDYKQPGRIVLKRPWIISCSLRLHCEPIMKPASHRHLVVSEAPRRSQLLLRIVRKTWFCGWWVRTRKEGLVAVAGSTSALVSSSDTRGVVSVGMPLDRSWVLSWARALSRAVWISCAS